MEYIKTEIIDDHIFVITMNRPDQRNAFNYAMSIEMEQALDTLEENPALRVGILRAEGKTFSAGMDLKAARNGERSVTEKRGGFGIMIKPPIKPLIAAVEGQALAGGMELTLCCDMIVASNQSIFGLPEVKRSLIAVGGACFRLTDRLPHQIAMEMILSGEPMSAEKMLHFGYVNHLAQPGEVLDAALDLARSIAECGPLAIRMTKETMQRAQTENWSEEQGWKEQDKIVAPIFASEDFKEGLVAFAEKRPPVWKGK